MFALRSSTSFSALGLVIGIALTSWLTALTYERAPATRPLAEVIMPGLSHKLFAKKPPEPAQPSRSHPAVAQRPPVPRAAIASPHADASAYASASGMAAPAARHDPLVPVYMPSPRYPMAALRAQREGQVILNVTVTQDGDVTDVSVGHSSGDLDLDHAATDAVRGWRFAAADNRPSRYTADLPIRFELTRL